MNVVLTIRNMTGPLSACEAVIAELDALVATIGTPRTRWRHGAAKYALPPTRVVEPLPLDVLPEPESSCATVADLIATLLRIDDEHVDTARATVWLAQLVATGLHPNLSALNEQMHADGGCIPVALLISEALASIDATIPTAPIDETSPWAQMLAAVVEWVADNWRFPAPKASDETERELGVWLAQQRRQNRRGALPAVMVEALDGALSTEWLENANARDDRTWLTRGLEFKAWRDAHGGAWPPAGTEHHEWLTAQRSAHTGVQGRHLSAIRKAWLDENLPGWEKGAHLAAARSARTEQVGAFYAENWHLPRTFSSRDHLSREEKNMGLWLDRQAELHAAGQLSPDEVDHLDLCAPGWRSRPSQYDETWLTTLDEARFWIGSHAGAMPVSNANRDAEEHRLGGWLTRQRVASERGNLDAEKVELLDATIPGWRVKRRASVKPPKATSRRDIMSGS